jgi:hypothetical protein
MGLHRLSLCLACIATVAIGVNAQPASAATSADQVTAQQISAFLANHPEAYRFSPYQVAFNQANVILTWPDPQTGAVPTRSDLRPDIQTTSAVQPNDVHGCPSGYFQPDWYCFYEDINFGGRMLEFKDCGANGLRQDFSDYSFRNQTSSWVNTTGNRVQVYDFASGADNLLWVEYSQASSSYVGNTNNDRADYFVTYC